MQIAGRMRQARLAAAERWKEATPYDRTVFGLAAVYVALVAAYLIWHRTFISPDQFFILVLLVSAILGRVRAFLRDWLPLVVLLFGYEFARGLAPVLNGRVYLRPMIDFDRFLFGKAPTITLQAKFYDPANPHWYDYAAVILYLLHFVVPLGAAFLLWLRNRQAFRQYAAGILILSYLAFLTYVIFPAAPPWLAAQAGLLPDVQRILGSTLLEFRDPVSLPTISSKFGLNMVAAVPSLHAAYPFFMTLFLGMRWRRMALPLAVYTFSVWMAVVYLGEHYVFDVVTGALYAAAAYLVVSWWPALRMIGKIPR